MRGLAPALAALLVFTSAAPAFTQPTPAVPPGAAPQTAQAAPGGDLPNVPGAINPDVTQDNIKSTICVSGWTHTIRPPVSYTDRLKRQLMQQYQLKGSLSDYELDHLVSLEIGGHPTDPNNLWMEHWADPRGARMKDALETKLKRLVCAGTITLAEAQQAIMTDWIAAYDRYVGTKAPKAQPARQPADRRHR